MSSPVCKAKDKNNCRYHTPAVHARMDRDTRQEVYEKALEAYSTGASDDKSLKTAVDNAKHKLVVAEVEYGVFDEGYNELKDRLSKKLNPSPEKTQLTRILERVEKTRAVKEKETREAEARKIRFEEIKKEVSAEETEAEKNRAFGWKKGYQQAISAMIVEDGYLVHNDAIDGDYNTSHKYTYGGRKNTEGTQHLKECSPLKVSDVEETSFYEFHDTYNTDNQSVVRGKVTCNCGTLVEQYIEVSGNFTDITRRLMSF